MTSPAAHGGWRGMVPPALPSPGRASLPTAALVLANLLPVAGALLLGWSVYDVMIGFWMETGIVALYGFAAVLLVLVPDRDPARDGRRRAGIVAGRLATTAFYGWAMAMMMMVHGSAVVGVFNFEAMREIGGEPGAVMRFLLADALRSPLVWSLAVSHGLEFVWRLRAGVFRAAPFSQVVVAPFGRMVVLHLALMLVALPTLLLGMPIVAVIGLVAVKLFVELRQWSHASGAEAAPALAAG